MGGGGKEGIFCLLRRDPQFDDFAGVSAPTVFISVRRAPDVPPNASVTYELELLNVQPPRDPEDMDITDLCAMG